MNKILLAIIFALSINTAVLLTREFTADYTLTDSQARAYCGVAKAEDLTLVPLSYYK